MKLSLEGDLSCEESHQGGRTGWLRAAVPGASGAIVSTASLMLGVAASGAPRDAILVVGVAGLVAGAMAMGVGEYVSVSSQRDAEQGDIARERRQPLGQEQTELLELAGIYVQRGLDQELARQVARQLRARDRLGARMRDELGMEPSSLARPLQAAWIAAASFASFGQVPIVALLLSPPWLRLPLIVVCSLLSLGALGALGGHLGGAPVVRASLRVTLGGALAMGVTAVIGHLLVSSVG